MKTALTSPTLQSMGRPREEMSRSQSSLSNFSFMNDVNILNIYFRVTGFAPSVRGEKIIEIFDQLKRRDK